MDCPTPADVIRAYARIQSSIIKTPVIENPVINQWVGARVFLKCENLQHIGAFKARGALNSALQLTGEQRQAGLVTYSSGNHAQAVAWAAQKTECKATIFMPTDAPAIKVEGVRFLGATIEYAGTTSDDRLQAALAFQRETGATMIEPSSHPWTIAGQGTATHEFVEELRSSRIKLSKLYVPCGGGGLIAGACLAADRDTDIIGVEPKGCDSMHQSIAAGQVKTVIPQPSLGDGLKTVRVGNHNLAICKDRLSSTTQVDDNDMLRAMAMLAKHAKLMVEPSGAAALAAAAIATHEPNSTLGILVSGGNVDPETMAKALTIA